LFVLAAWSLQRANDSHDLLDGAGYCSNAARQSIDQGIQLCYSWSTPSARRGFATFNLTQIFA
jgi:hypothetical protein